MNVAVCISGLPRLWEQSLNNLFRHLIQPLNADVYMHLWNPEFLNKDEYAQRNSDNISIGNMFQVMHKLFRPKCIKFENYEQKEYLFSKTFNRTRSEVKSKNTLAMYYKLKMVNQLMRAHEATLPYNYDIVIRCRTELMFDRSLTLEELELARIGCLLVPLGADHEGINDRMAISSPEVMDIYCSICDYVQKYYDSGCIFHPESLMLWHVYLHQLSVTRIPFTCEVSRKQ